MTKSEILGRKLNKAIDLIESAKLLVEEVAAADENGDGESVGLFMSQADDLVDLVSEVGYEILMPMQMEEEEVARQAEIRALEARLAELRSME